MDFKKFLSMMAEAESTAEKDNKAEKAGKKVAKDIEYDEGHKGKDDHKAEKAGEKVKKDIEYDDKKDKKEKKSLKDWFDIVDKNMIAENTVTKGYTQPLQIKQGSSPATTITDPSTKSTITTTNPNVVAAAKKGELQVGKQLQEEPVEEKWAGDAKVKPTGQYKDKTKEELKSMLAKLHKSGPHDKDSPAAKKMRQINFALRAKGGWKSGEGAAMKEESMDESGLQAYLGNKKYGKKGMDALRKAGREGASKEKMAQIRAKHDKLDEVQIDEKAVSKAQQKFMGMVHAAQKGEKPASKAVADVAKSMKKGDVKDFAQTKHKGLPEKKKKTSEAEIPKSGPDYGAGLGAGRSQSTFEGKKPDFLDLDKDGNKKESMKKAAADKKKKKVNESMNNKHKAAYHEGYTHGLRELACRVKHYEDMEEAKQYFEGYKLGLEECYGMGENAVIGETPNMPQSVPAMAHAAMPAMEADIAEMDKTEYMQHKAKTTPGDTFKAFGQTFKDKEVLEMDDFAFESLDKQLNELLNEGAEIVNEGLSVNMSQGLGGMGEDTVSVSATGDDASKLLDFIKQVGLGGLGGAEENHGEPAAVVAVSDYGAPKFTGHDGMAELMKKVGVDDNADDYKLEKGHDHEHSDTCGCEKVDEVETADQRLYNVAEDDGEGYEQSQAAGAEIDSALASKQDVDVTEGGDGGEASEEPVMSEESKSEEDDHAEKAGKEVDKDIEHDEGHKGKDDDEAEEAGEKVTKDIEYDDEKDEEEKKDKEKVDEWANDAGKKGTDQAFEEDINFMTKVISGGLNKPKATGQTTIPVIPGQDARIGESMDDAEVVQWKRLAGLA